MSRKLNQLWIGIALVAAPTLIATWALRMQPAAPPSASDAAALDGRRGETVERLAELPVESASLPESTPEGVVATPGKAREAERAAHIERWPRMPSRTESYAPNPGAAHLPPEGMEAPQSALRRGALDAWSPLPEPVQP